MAIYLDHHATTPLDPAVFEAMRPWLTDHVGNASSRTHSAGIAAARAVEVAREQLGECVDADPGDLVFTSGATESCAWALMGTAAAAPAGRCHVVTLSTEHSAVLEHVAALKRRGFRVSVVGVGPNGQLDLDALRSVLSAQTAVVSAMAANNEIGVLHPISAVADLCHEVGARLHVDAAQIVGRLPWSVEASGADLVSFSAHKMYGPVGVGALFIRSRPRRVPLDPLLYGRQERGLRGGTLPTPLIVGFGHAAALVQHRVEQDSAALCEATALLWTRLQALVDGIGLNGPPLERRLPGNLNVWLPHVQAWELLRALPSVQASAGSACASSQREGSHVLTALGGGESRVRQSIRLGIGRTNSRAEIIQAADEIASVYRALRT